jgi:hypothetical protein
MAMKNERTTQSHDTTGRAFHGVEFFLDEVGEDVELEMSVNFCFSTTREKNLNAVRGTNAGRLCPPP